ncbi:MAG: TPM domain-containing protein [Desulfarculaceae bacterium]|nr:TPM domain-containing protein [Desulfarculaceae bacterium]MCF8073849.1 TPM domain-containing protein [Desulfarculaceae bacterium]MCF8102829.1 TPM domain-containing protein [Desulfarculaceae bacterium]MCF8116273.1 TPM domain-containing protein [Desulfarculaceae bacterium]
MRTRRPSALLSALLLVVFLAAPAWAALDYARPTGPGGVPASVGDYAKIIPANIKQAMENLSAELLQKTGASLVVATLPSLDGESIEQAAVQLFQKWGIGKKGQDKGVLLLVAPTERKMRIEVGYGLEGVLTDATSGAIRDQYMLPFFKKGDFGKGLLNGAAAAASVVAQSEGVKLTGVPEVKIKTGSRGFGIGGLFLVLIAFWLFMRMFGRKGGKGGRGGGSGILPAILLGSMMGGSMGGGMHRGGGFGGFGGGFGGFGGGMSGGGGASGGW